VELSLRWYYLTCFLVSHTTHFLQIECLSEGAAIEIEECV
jgi:hypothetical protein